VLLVLVIIALGYVAFVKNNKEVSQQNGVNSLLLELNKEMNKPNASLETINNFLVSKYGPCWGIPEDQCSE
jgi:hypothetical protein